MYCVIQVSVRCWWHSAVLVADLRSRNQYWAFQSQQYVRNGGAPGGSIVRRCLVPDIAPTRATNGSQLVVIAQVGERVKCAGHSPPNIYSQKKLQKGIMDVVNVD